MPDVISDLISQRNMSLGTHTLIACGEDNLTSLQTGHIGE